MDTLYWMSVELLQSYSNNNNTTITTSTNNNNNKYRSGFGCAHSWVLYVMAPDGCVFLASANTAYERLNKLIWWVKSCTWARKMLNYALHDFPNRPKRSGPAKFPSIISLMLSFFLLAVPQIFVSRRIFRESVDIWKVSAQESLLLLTFRTGKKNALIQSIKVTMQKGFLREVANAMEFTALCCKCSRLCLCQGRVCVLFYVGIVFMTKIIRLNPDRQHIAWLIRLKLFETIYKNPFNTPDGVPNNEWNNYEFVNNTQLTARR